MQQPGWGPDFGPGEFPPKSGATVIGARGVLVAFNISIDAADLAAAEDIASRIRSRGYFATVAGVREKVPGLLPKTRAIGWYMADYGQAQVSINLLDYRETSPLQAWEACRELASARGLKLGGSEVIGLIPEACLMEAGTFAMVARGEPVSPDPLIIVHEAIRYLGLNRLRVFHPREKVLEYALAAAGLYL